MKKRGIILSVFLVLVMLPTFAFAGTVTGSVQGFNCVTQGKVCPIGQEDPMAAAERVFVILTKDGDYYFVPNIDRAMMARHINEEVRATGKVDKKYKSITVDKFEIHKGDAWKTIWSPALEKQINELIGAIGAP